MLLKALVVLLLVAGAAGGAFWWAGRGAGTVHYTGFVDGEQAPARVAGYRSGTKGGSLDRRRAITGSSPRDVARTSLICQARAEPLTEWTPRRGAPWVGRRREPCASTDGHLQAQR